MPFPGSVNATGVSTQRRVRADPLQMELLYAKRRQEKFAHGRGLVYRPFTGHSTRWVAGTWCGGRKAPIWRLMHEMQSLYARLLQRAPSEIGLKGTVWSAQILPPVRLTVEGWSIQGIGVKEERRDHAHPPQFIYLGDTHQCAVNLNAPQNSAQCAVDALAADSMISEKAARVRDGRVDGGIPRGRRTGLTASRVINDRRL
ncbi:hypothetical protein B0H13DRAFT_1868378 [Mycena leptocephala]|nr:hypothetical protein B0H13DRAFT_1868378 [Mycena leptocephala]